jgi:hypothetical protein
MLSRHSDSNSWHVAWKKKKKKAVQRVGECYTQATRPQGHVRLANVPGLQSISHILRD